MLNLKKKKQQTNTHNTELQGRKQCSAYFLMEKHIPQCQTPSGITCCWVLCHPVNILWALQPPVTLPVAQYQCPAAVVTTPMMCRDKDNKCILLTNKDDRHTEITVTSLLQKSLGLQKFLDHYGIPLYFRYFFFHFTMNMRYIFFKVPTRIF